jgi:tRNA (guanosine-2'-O-)-methyltransferase
VTDPGGELAEVGRVTDAGLIKDRDCPGPKSDCHGQNMENVFLERDKDLTRGRYRVRIRLEKLGGQEPPIVVTFGARAGPKTYSAEVSLARQEEEQELIISL